MSLTVSKALISASKASSLDDYREWATSSRGETEIAIDTTKLDEAGFKDLLRAAHSVGDKKAERAIESVLRALGGEFGTPLPNFKAFQPILEAFLKANLIDGWLYAVGPDGKLYPELVTNIIFDAGRHANGTPTVHVQTLSYGIAESRHYKSELAVHSSRHSFAPQQVAKRRIADILANAGLYPETPELKRAHLAAQERHRKLIQGAFTQQFRLTGVACAYEENNWQRRGAKIENRRVIHDLASDECAAMSPYAESKLFPVDDGHDGTGPVPEHPLVRVFDLNTHEFLWVHSDFLTPYRYDKSLREKLILPQTHRDLLDVLTTNLDAFIEDIIEGKSAGNVVLCKGIPGLGKTLTAEVYAELIERPLYSVHSGALGTTAEAIEKNLQEIFQRAKRWGCVLLLDEADVFVVERGQNLEQNAIVAEFLRALEYFDGLLFMTTNRPEDIDEAIISRCAAIINYEIPKREETRLVWQVMAGQYKAKLPGALIDQLLDLFPTIAPRDIKMLLRLALRVAAGKKEPLCLDTFRRCAMFRAVDIAQSSATAA